MTLKMYQEPAKEQISNIKHIIGIAAGKGGVGKSTVTVQLALALKEIGFKVGILDSDIYGPSVRKMLPEEKLPAKQGDYLIPAFSNGIPYISFSFFRPEEEASAVRAPIANNIIMQFLQQIAWGPLDYLLIDFPPGTGDIQLTLAQKSNLSGAILVTTPQEIALLDVRKAAHLFRLVHIPLIGIVENMSFFIDEHGNQHRIFGEGGGEKLAEESGSSLLAKVPLDSVLCEFGDKGKSIYAEAVNSKTEKSRQIFLDLAKRVEARCDELGGREAGKEFVMAWKEELK